MSHLSPEIIDAKRAAFLTALAETGIISAAAKVVGVNRSTVFRWREDPAFAEAFQDAIEQAADKIEAEAIRRAVEGFEEPVWYRGIEVGKITRHSDYLLGLLLKANRPDKYRENSRVELAGGTKNELRIVSEFGGDEFDGSDLV